jgi:hypothetical protein
MSSSIIFVFLNFFFGDEIDDDVVVFDEFDVDDIERDFLMFRR